MPERTEVVVSQPRRMDVVSDAMNTEAIVQQVSLIQGVMKSVMSKGEHYDVIPGTSGRPSLLKPGAEKLGLTFRLAPGYTVERTELPNGHREYLVHCFLTHIPTRDVVGEGLGSCSTMESKYRYRKAERVCPECGVPAIIKGKPEYGGGWVCFKRKDGCGAKFKDGDHQIENQENGRVEFSDPADYFNTVLKMAKKRAHVDAILTATAASDIFTQDVEDLPGGDRSPHPENPPQGPAQNSTPSQGSSRPSDSVGGQPVAKAPSDADRLKQDAAVALAVSLGIAPEDLNAFCEANMSRIPLFEMVGGALVALTGKIKSGVVEQWALAQKGGKA